MSSAPSIVVHHLRDSRGQRIIWLLEELEVPYEVKVYEHIPPRLAPPEMGKLHPLGKSPIITDGEITLAESGAVVEYLLTKYGKGKGMPSPEGWVDNLYCERVCLSGGTSNSSPSGKDTHYAEGTLMPLRELEFPGVLRGPMKNGV